MAGLVIETDTVATRRRIARLRRYVRTHLLDDQRRFICPHWRDCRASIASSDTFREGTMSHVGHHYDLFRKDTPLRIVVVGQESGWQSEGTAPGSGRLVHLSERHRAVHDISGLASSYYAGGGRPGRNPHMRGTTSVLRVILGKGLGADHDEEWVTPVDGPAFHLFDGFALVNRLLCSASSEGSSQGRSSRLMRDHCVEHFQATLRILEPTLIVLQGQAVSRWTDGTLTPIRRYGAHLFRAELEGRRVLVCSFSHPAAHGSLRWGDDLRAPYLTGTVAPTLREALRRL